ncbi:hypothetical protein ACFSTD_01465 [Novosphingobium colocasiae]
MLQARAHYRVQRADLVPSTTLSGSASYTSNIQGASGALGGGAGASAGGAGSGTGVGGRRRATSSSTQSMPVSLPSS